MADLAIDYGNLNYSTGNKTILPYISDFIVEALRNRGNPLKKFTNVSNAITKQGDTIRVIVTPNVTSNLLTDGSNRVLDNTTPTAVDCVVSNNRYTSFQVTDMACVLSGDVNQESLLKGRFSSLLNDIEADFMGMFQLGISTNVVGTFGSGTITEAEIQSAVTKLYNQKAPHGHFHGLLSPACTTALDGITNFNAAYVRGYMPGEMAPAFSEDFGENGKPWYNTLFHMSQSVAQPVVSGVTNVYNVIGHPEAAVIAMRPIDTKANGSMAYVSEPFTDDVSGVAGSIVFAKNFLTFGDEVTFRCLYGMSIVKEPWLALIQA